MSAVAYEREDAFDWRAPDYGPIYRNRLQRLRILRSNPSMLAAAKLHYRYHPWDFVMDWGVISEPRNIAKGLPSRLPFHLFERQSEYLKWLYGRWRMGKPGVVEKSRDMGVSWLSIGLATTLWIFEPGFVAGLGSRKAEYVDVRGDMKSLFEKVRSFLDQLPDILLPDGYDSRAWRAYMRITNPHTDGAIVGESGDQIGRGGRTSMYLVDEAAFVEHQDLIDAALSANTDCQVDVSSVNGTGNAFYRKCMDTTGEDEGHFIFDWRQDPRKSEEWYAAKRHQYRNRLWIVASEIDRDFSAAQENVFIPSAWVVAAIDAHEKLGIAPSGIRVTAFDPADTGDAKAVINRWGSVVMQAKAMSTGTIEQALPWAFNEADMFRADVLIFDGDGLGTPVMRLGLAAMSAGRMVVVPYYGSGDVQEGHLPHGAEGLDPIERAKTKSNDDTFGNFRAQSWWRARDRFAKTFEAIERHAKGWAVNVKPEDIISISSKCERLHELQAELSRPMRVFSKNGKILVEDKAHMKARGVDSTNLADALVMAFAAQQPRKQRVFVEETHQVHDRGVGW